MIGIANNGEEAVLKFKSFSERPDIILMDYRMPIKNGIEAAKEILKIDNKSKIIFISAEGNAKDKFLSIGAICFIEKPFTIKKLVKKIKNVLLKQRSYGVA